MAQVKVFSLGGIGAPCCCGGGTLICVTVCGGIPVAGALVEIFTGASLVDSCTTDPTGCCTLNDSGTYTLKVTVSGTLSYTGSQTLAGSTITVALGGTTPVVCCGAYAIPESMTLTDAAGSVTIGYFGLDGFGNNVWYACVLVNRLCASVTTPGGICTLGTVATQPMVVCYKMLCLASGPPYFQINRFWGWVDVLPLPGPTWYDGGGSCSAPGALCAAASPALCGGFTDESDDSQNPTTTTPFAISFTPVPGGGNSTADPIGGSVAIS